MLNGFMKPVTHKSAKAKLTTNMFPTFLKGCKNYKILSWVGDGENM